MLTVIPSSWLIKVEGVGLFIAEIQDDDLMAESHLRVVYVSRVDDVCGQGNLTSLAPFSPRFEFVSAECARNLREKLAIIRLEPRKPVHHLASGLAVTQKKLRLFASLPRRRMERNKITYRLTRSQAILDVALENDAIRFSESESLVD